MSEQQGAELIVAPELPQPRGGELAPAGDGSTFGLLPRAVQLARTIAGTAFVKRGLRENVPAITAAILAGHELGLPPMASLAYIDVIDGQPALRAVAMRALIQSHGHRIWFPESTTTRCTIGGRRRGEDEATLVTWTKQDAETAKLSHKDSWKNYPRAMLVARATGELARMMFSDVIAGLPYVSEELADQLEGVRDVVDGHVAPPPAAPVAEELPPETPVTTTRQAPRRARKAESPPPSDGAAAPVPSPAPSAAAGETWSTLDVPGDALAGSPAPGPGGVRERPPQADAPASEAPPADGEGRPPVSSGVISVERAQEVAMWCRDAGIDDVDRPHLVGAASNGRVTSARELTEPEAAVALDMARAIQRGEKRLAGTTDGRWIVTYRDIVEIRDETLNLLQRLVKADRPKAEQLLAEAGWSKAKGNVSIWVGSLLKPDLLQLLAALRPAVAVR